MAALRRLKAGAAGAYKVWSPALGTGRWQSGGEEGIRGVEKKKILYGPCQKCHCASCCGDEIIIASHQFQTEFPGLMST